MTDSKSPISPFIGSTPSQAEPIEVPEFSIRTMQDELKELEQKKLSSPTQAAQQKSTPPVATSQEHFSPEPKKITPKPETTTMPVPPKPEPVQIAKPTPMVEPILKATPVQPAQAMPAQKLPATSPFSSSENSPLSSQKKTPSTIADPAQKTLVEIPAVENIQQKESGTAYKTIVVIIIILIIAILGLGGYYFYMTRQSQTPQEEQPTVIQATTPTETAPEKPAPTEDAPVVIAPPTEKYSATKPNFLPLDIAQITSADITKTILDISTELQTGTAKQAVYEFVVVDSNNNPIAFPIFATAAKLNLSPSLLDQLGENFSLYFYNDNGKMHLAISTSTTKKETLRAELLKQERTFLKDASFLFLGEATDIENGTFSSSTYGNFDIRYLNAKKDNTLSIDYTLSDSSLIIGTSKNTLRAVIDKLSMK